MMPKISIIIPVYKVEKYLNRCLDSILAQTYSDFELILVDDGSPDRSGSICDEYAQKDSRIRVIHKENGGVSTARNAGMKEATGEWITFIDSDDWVESCMLESCLNAINSEECELVVFGVRDDFPLSGRYPIIDYSDSNKATDLGSQLALADRKNMLKGPCNKLFKLNILKRTGLMFDENMRYGEDTKFTFNYLMFCSHVNFSWEALYHYVHYPGEGLTAYNYTCQQWIDIAKMCYCVRKPVYDKFSIKDCNYLKYMYFSHYIRGVLSLYGDKEIAKIKRISLLKEIVKDRRMISYKPQSKFYRLLWYSRFSTSLMDFICKIYSSR